MVRFFAIFLALHLNFSLIDSTSAQSAREEVKIGVILPLSGNSAVYSIDAQPILSLLQDKFNNQSSKYQYKLIFEEGQCGTGNYSINAAKKLSSIDQSSFILAACSGEVLQIAPFTESKKILVIGFASSHPDVKNAGSYVFRTYPDIDTGVTKLTKVIQKNGFSKIAIITEEMSFTEGVRRSLLRELGSKIIFDEYFKVGETDFRSILTKARAAKPDAIYLNAGTPTTYQALITQLKEQGITAALFSYHQPADDSSLKNLGKKQEGVVFISVPGEDGITGDYKAVRDQYTKSHDGTVHIPAIAQSAYDAATTLFNAIEAVGPDTMKVRDFMSKWHGIGATGPIVFNAAGDMEGVSMALQIIRDGKAVAY